MSEVTSWVPCEDQKYSCQSPTYRTQWHPINNIGSFYWIQIFISSYVHLGWTSCVSSYFILNCRSFFPFTRWTWKRTFQSVPSGQITCRFFRRKTLQFYNDFTSVSSLWSSLHCDDHCQPLHSAREYQAGEHHGSRAGRGRAVHLSELSNWAFGSKIEAKLHLSELSNWALRFIDWRGWPEKSLQRGRLEWPGRFRPGCWLWSTESAKSQILGIILRSWRFTVYKGCSHSPRLVVQEVSRFQLRSSLKSFT